ncbi:hypothetical protein [uncultured Jannaschia sp.]|uniref:hypothetical protein n=1 Tax=uncultured Jannaschia sp. TaxID=293347 RepID=UPI00260D3EFA|nr:hypothetical protein [uncultured Jannaschia sp.]
MPDRITTDPARTGDWQDRLSAGDTVSFRFPVAEEDGPQPKARPCLVLDVQDIDGVRHALMAYGTSRKTRKNCGFEVEVCKTEARAAAGLDRRTRFIGARRVRVALGDPAFVCCRQRDTPILDRLVGGELARLETLRARFGSDLAAAILSAGDGRSSRPAQEVTGRRRRTWPRRPAGRRDDRTCRSAPQDLPA